MSEPENVETVRRLYRAFVEGDVPAILNLVAGDVDWQFFGSANIPWAGPRRGHAGVEQFFRSAGEAIAIEIFEPDEFISAGDSVIVLGHERVRMHTNGRRVEANWAHIWTLRNGLICRLREYSDTAAWEAGFQK